MPNAALSEAIKEAYASAPSEQIILHTLELRHPAFVGETGQLVAIRVVRDTGDLWARLESLTDKDDFHGQPADPRVSADPDDPHFSLSFGGEAFFVVGLHPQASRPARRFERPALIFNLHDQFVQLRASGVYDKMRSTIIARDVALAGDVNPMLAPHGSVSEARQYSGRAVGADWSCPFAGRSGAFAPRGKGQAMFPDLRSADVTETVSGARSRSPSPTNIAEAGR